jgi:hypothetical protein
MRRSFVYYFILIITLASIPASVWGWGSKGHATVNRLAVGAAAPRLPAFMRAAADQITYNGDEPDRWREESGTQLAVAQAPDHFFNSEYWGSIATIEKDRYAFMAKLVERKIDLAKVGYLPYAIVEEYGRLRNAFRIWRRARTASERESARANAVFYAGVLGHYVADGSQPLHLSIHYNGWADGEPNPRNFTRNRMFHSRFETAFVTRAIDASRVRQKVQPPQRLPDVFGAVKGYLIQSFNDLEPVYELEKSGEFNPESPRSKGTEFVERELARGATMLSNLWYTAWLESAEPVTRGAAPAP